MIVLFSREPVPLLLVDCTVRVHIHYLLSKLDRKTLYFFELLVSSCNSVSGFGSLNTPIQMLEKILLLVGKVVIFWARFLLFVASGFCMVRIANAYAFLYLMWHNSIKVNLWYNTKCNMPNWFSSAQFSVYRIAFRDWLHQKVYAFGVYFADARDVAYRSTLHFYC